MDLIEEVDINKTSRLHYKLNNRVNATRMMANVTKEALLGYLLVFNGIVIVVIVPYITMTGKLQVSKQLLTVSHTDERYNLPLLTFTTTMFTTSRRNITNSNTLLNWQALDEFSFINKILYIDFNDTVLINMAKSAGWDVKPVPVVKRGIPVIKYIFLDAMKTYDTFYYGFSNADILFGDDLLDTLRMIKEKVKQYEEVKQKHDTDIFITGRRTNIKISHFKGSVIYKPLAVRKYIRYGKILTAKGQDYFFMTKNAINWEKFPEFVIGRLIWDNWLLVTALLNTNLFLVDSSATVSALHQTTGQGVGTGRRHRDGINQAVSKHLYLQYALKAGETECAPYSTLRTVPQGIELYRRRGTKGVCHSALRRYYRLIKNRHGAKKVHKAHNIKVSSSHITSVDNKINNNNDTVIIQFAPPRSIIAPRRVVKRRRKSG